MSLNCLYIYLFCICIWCLISPSSLLKIKNTLIQHDLIQSNSVFEKFFYMKCKINFIISFICYKSRNVGLWYDYWRIKIKIFTTMLKLSQYLHSWKLCVKFNAFHIFQTDHLNFYVNVTQDEYIRKQRKHYVKINIENI